jgi:hypothetical protein
MRWHQYLCLTVRLDRARQNRGKLTDFDSAESDHGAVDLVDGPIDLFKII